jgi:hypothetical protein
MNQKTAHQQAIEDEAEAQKREEERQAKAKADAKGELPINPPDKPERPVKPSKPNPKLDDLTPDQQAGLARFRRIEEKDQRVAYAWLALHNRTGSPQDAAFEALMIVDGSEAIKGYFTKFGQYGQGALFGPVKSGGQGFVWGYYPSGKGDYSAWEQSFDHNSITMPPPNDAAVVVDVL